MPVQVSYPGVYIQEIPSGSHTISGVATSITAFMGRAVCGPLGQVDGPVTIFSFQDYQKIFGGLSHDSPMSYAVRDFFINGGSQAVIVRLFEQISNSSAYPVSPPDTPDDHYKARFYADAPQVTSPPFASPLDYASPPLSGSLELIAANPGTWGNYLVAMVDHVNPDTTKPQIMAKFAQYNVAADDPLFNLSVYYNPPSGIIQSERFTNLMVTGGRHNPNRIDNVLKSQSMLVRYSGDLPDDPVENVNPLSPLWVADWQAFNDDLAKSNVPQTKLLTLLPGPNSYGGIPAPTDSDVISSNTYGTDGQKALDQVDLFNLLCVPPDSEDSAQDTTLPNTAALLVPYCVQRRAMMILDPLLAWSDDAKQDKWDQIQPTDYGLNGDVGRNAAVYFPRVIEADPLMKNQPINLPACGIIAGVIATTDLQRGVWKAPAGIDAGVNNILQLEYKMTNDQNGILNPLGVNCLRTFPVIGSVVWGARTLRGADELEDDYKYLNVRRLTLYVEESLYRGTQWAVFEPNDSTLWGSLKTSINAFLAGLQRQGAFYSYFVQCDATTTTPDDISLGIVNILVGIAPVKPAEFVVISIQQQALQPSS
jgi:Bacteriophage tail sheath protein